VGLTSGRCCGIMPLKEYPPKAGDGGDEGYPFGRRNAVAYGTIFGNAVVV